MKHAHFSKRAAAILLSSVLLLIFSGCSQNGGVSSAFGSSAASSDEPASLSAEIPLPTQSGTSAITTSDAPADSGETSSEATLSGISPLSAYQSVLQNKGEFFSTDANKNLNISQLNQAISPEVTVDVANFAVIDIGHGGTPAVILSLNVNGNGYGVEVLSYQDGIVYGYTFSGRQFGNLRTDGTFVSSGGAADVGICTITFDKNTYSIDKFTYCESNTDSENNTSEVYFVNHQSATEDEYNAAFSQWQKIPYVTWYDFTAANIANIGTKPDAPTSDQVSRGAYVQGIISNVVIDSNTIKSITIKVTKNRPEYANNPIEYDDQGKTIDLVLRNEYDELTAEQLKGLQQKLKSGTEVILGFAQYLTNGKEPVKESVQGKDIYFKDNNGKFINVQGLDIEDKGR